jgi:amino acid adenylation domain-containing protein
MTASQDDRAERLRRAIHARQAAPERRSAVPARPAGAPARLSEAQRSLWLVHQLEPTSSAYTLASACLVHGALDLARLEHAFNVVLGRHRLLRSTFRGDGHDVQQVVHRPVARPVQIVDARDGELEHTATRIAREPFVLERGPLVRMAVVRERTTGRQLLLLVLHHILADEASLSTLWNELAAAFDGRLADEPAAVQYDDYVHWLTALGEGGRRAQDVDYWRNRLAPAPPILELPFELTPSADGPHGRLLTRQLDATLVAPIQRLASMAGGTAFGVFAFAFRLLLDRYTGGEPIAIATPVSTRAHADTNGMIGYFLNPVVIGSAPDERATVLEAVGEFTRQVREDVAHAPLPFSAVVEAVGPPRRPDRHPLFQAMFVQRQPQSLPALGASRLEPLQLDLGSSKFDLTLFVTASNQQLECAVEFRSDRYDSLWMERLLGHYEALLRELPRHPSSAVSAVEMLAAAEREQLNRFARGPELTPGSPDSVLGQILDRARTAPDDVAVAFDGLSVSYGELQRQARGLARALAAAGVSPGDRVGVFVDRSASLVVAVLGSLLAGAAYVPLDPSYPAARTGEVLSDASVSAVVTTSTLAVRLPSGSWPVVHLDEVDVLGVDGGNSPLPVVAPGMSAYVLYTSGSTGRPKGVVVSHANLAASTHARLQLYDARPERFLLVPSVAFDSSVAGLFWTLAAGGTLVVPTDDQVRDARLLAQLVQAERVTALLAVPSLYLQMLDTAAEALDGLELVIVAGEACPPRLVQAHFGRLPNVRLWNEYGPTEATVWATAHEITKDEGASVPIGRPIPGVQVEVLDRHGRPVPPGIPGVAWISGPTVAQGYWRRPDLTSERFVAAEGGVRYCTGDRVSWTPDGRLVFLGREDEQLKIRGFRIEPGEIETALMDVPEIAEAVVVARHAVGRTDRDALVAFVRAAGADVPGWRESLATRLPAHMLPTRLIVLPDLPRLPNGKVDRRHLETLPLEEPSPSAATVAPGTREEMLTALWEGVLGRRGIRDTDNFFELGGHSLQVMEMVLALERDFGVPLSVAEVFQHPTIGDLARRIGDRQAPGTAEYRHLFPIQTSGRGRPFVIAVPDFFAPIFAERFRGERPVYGLRGVSNRPEGNYRRWRSLRALGEELAGEMARRFPGERMILAGYSFGATLAVEAARALEARGTPAERVYMIAPMALDYYHLGPFRVQLDALGQPVETLSTRQALAHFIRSNHPMTRPPYARARRRFVTQPWRRVLSVVGRVRHALGRPLTPDIMFADVRVERFRLHDAYRPAPIRTPTVIFNASGTATDAAATWRPWFHGPLTVHDTPDPHREAQIAGARDVILRHMGDLGA